MAAGKTHCTLFLLLFVSYAYVHQDYRGGTPLSRLDLLHSIFVKKTVQIDSYHTNTTDKAYFRGHYYSDKAPGTVVLALPGFAVAAKTLQHRGIQLDSDSGWLFSSWIATALSISLMTALGGVAIFAWLSKRLPHRTALVSTLALFLGAAPFPYATVMFSHAFVIALIGTALWALAGKTTPPFGSPDRDSWRDVCAGFVGGVAIASEFTAGIVVYGMFLIVFTCGIRQTLHFLAGLLPPLLLIPVYSWVCFGNPFTIGYSHQAEFPEMKRGLYGIDFPNIGTAANLLISPTRGLFFWSPVFAMAIVGYFRLFNLSRKLFWLTLLVPVAQVVCISGYTWDWHAGASLGPRYLSPMLPLLILPTGLGIQKYPLLGIPLAALSILLTGGATLINGTPGYEENPLVETHVPAFLEARYLPNLGSLCGLHGHWSIAPLFFFWAVCLYLLWQSSKPPVENGDIRQNLGKNEGENG